MFRFRFYEGRSDRRERTGPALLQGGGVAIGFGGLDARDAGTIEPIPSKPINLDAIETAHGIQRAQFRPQITVENRRKRPRSKCMPQQPCELSWKRYGLDRIGRKRNR